MWTSPYVVVLYVLILVWSGVSAYVLITRALYDFRHHAFHGARRLVQHWIARGSTPEERERTLRRLPRRTLAGIASDAHVDPEISAAAARVLLDHRWRRIQRRASAHRNEAEKWARIAALRIFVVADWPVAWSLLETALHDPDDDVVAAAVALLGERDEEASTQLLVYALVHDCYQRSRIATHLDGRDEAEKYLLPLVDHPDDDVRYWVAALLRPSTPESELALVSLAGDRSPNVRAAVAKSFTALGGAAAAAVAPSLLTDPVWFVRAQAARTLTAGREAGVSEELVTLLRDDHWWVRSAAKEGLLELGHAAMPALAAALSDSDRFARNGAAEVLYELQALEAWRGDEARLTELLAAGETPVQQAALREASGPARAVLERIIARLPATRTA